MKEWLNACFSFNIADYIIVTVVLLSTIVSLFRGLVKEIFSLVTWVIGFGSALKFSGRFAATFTKYIANPTIRYIIIFIAIFILVMIIGTLLNRLFSLFVARSGLSGADHLLGMVFGSVRGLLLIGVILLLINFTSFVEDSWWQNSMLIPYFKVMLKWLGKIVPEGMDALRSIDI